MLGNKKQMSAGDNSINVQGESITINTGISYADAKEIALQTFKDNFYKLSEAAQRTAMERADLLVTTFLEKLQSGTPENINKILDPDVQYALVNAQKQYARNGSELTLELLTNLLEERFRIDEGSLKKIVLNESIEVIAKLTTDQVRVIAGIFLVKYSVSSSARYLIETLSPVLDDNFENIKNDFSFFEHLLFTGVASNDISTQSSQNLEYFIRKSYEGEITYKIDGTNMKLDPVVRSQFEIDTLSKNVFERWNSSLISRYSLTSVGKAVAVAYYNSMKGAKADLDMWIKN
ncbi:LPO_1073/Vpar_1526 family protein [Paenibacillus sp. FSL W8-0187]|uniref:LPO_1073/Vpar_1526 family protein n=1 Tax=Paenibacillus sp. FSL W8-0187 TaxID=2921710 RepID=UPI0030DD0833